MAVIAIIPVKVFGSLGLPGKFCKELCGLEMWEYVTKAAYSSNRIDKIYMTGNKDEVKTFFPKVEMKYPKIKWITRPKKSQQNGVELLDVMKFCLEKIGKEDDIFIQLQATKPLTTSTLLDEIVDYFIANKCNSLFTVQEIKTAVNWEYKSCRQEGKKNFKSNAVVKMWDYESLKNAKSGTWGFGKNHYNYFIPDHHIEVDTFQDFKIAEALKKAGF